VQCVGDFGLFVSSVAVNVEESADFGQCDGDEASVYWWWVGLGGVFGYLFVL
jgi:hypothetical protein